MDFISGGLTTGFPEALNLKEIADMMRRAKQADEGRKLNTQAAIRQMEPCRVCGERIEYHPEPERYVMCDHVIAALKKQAPHTLAAADALGVMNLAGMPVYRKWTTQVVSAGTTKGGE